MQCKCFTGSGSQCSRTASTGQQYCWQHQTCAKPYSGQARASSPKPQGIKGKQLTFEHPAFDRVCKSYSDEGTCRKNVGCDWSPEKKNCYKSRAYKTRAVEMKAANVLYAAAQEIKKGRSLRKVNQPK